MWHDLDGDGIQDPGEPGVAGVTVELFRVGEQAPVDSIVTDANGAYLFDNFPSRSITSGSSYPTHHLSFSRFLAKVAKASIATLIPQRPILLLG